MWALGIKSNKVITLATYVIQQIVSISSEFLQFIVCIKQWKKLSIDKKFLLPLDNSKLNLHDLCLGMEKGSRLKRNFPMNTKLMQLLHQPSPLTRVCEMKRLKSFQKIVVTVDYNEPSNVFFIYLNWKCGNCSKNIQFDHTSFYTWNELSFIIISIPISNAKIMLTPD